MNVKLAETAGFCFGVKRAVDMVYAENEKNDKKVYTYGPIIHNEQVVKDLENKGVFAINSLDELEKCERGIVVIRSHGVSEEVCKKLENSGFEVVDATCPFVKKIHRAVKEYSEKGYRIIITGNAKHPEVEGIMGWGNPDQITVISEKEEAEGLDFPKGTDVCIVSQTTFNHKKFQDLVEIVDKKGYNMFVLNTICNATEERQKEAAKISADVDMMIVIGGKNSSNTQKLFEICKNECENTYYIQTLDDLTIRETGSIGSVGITAGASTPNNIIEEVQKYVRNEL
ncbi:MAG: 4-hydroxy-3-methylbut-2-enyl diphosphate reductase [Lachnospiraceae bacterium]|nr:4-hydroxy-3-methylbut-2-enyl diphosphate reductase [Lachnospiraceae bacterium]